MMLPFFIAALHHGMAAVIVPSSHDSVDRLFWNTQRFIDYVAMPLFLITSFLLVAMPGALVASLLILEHMIDYDHFGIHTLFRRVFLSLDQESIHSALLEKLGQGNHS